MPATTGPCHGDADVGRTIVDKATGTILQQTSGEADGSFTQVETLESLKMLPLNRATRKLLAMGRHPGAKIEHELRTKASA